MKKEQGQGTVFWLTGLSGAGKTTIGHLFYEYLKTKKSNLVFLDGDILREVFDNDLGHSLSEREKSAGRNSRLCRMLAAQGLDVICATISMFHGCREWNRQNISKYTEIYIKVPIEVLIQRDQKQLYSRAIRGEVKDIMGIDLIVEEPSNPDIVLDNDGSRKASELVGELIEKLNNLRV